MGYTGYNKSAAAWKQNAPRVTPEQLIANLPPLSDEQAAIVEYLQAGRGDLVINAVAGSGKTTSLKHIIARLNSDRVIYCVFSKEMEREVKPQLNGLCEVKTTYAVGYAAIRYALKLNLDVQESKYNRLARVQANVLASQMRLVNQTETAGPQEKEIEGAIVQLINLCQMNLADPANLDDLYALADHYGVDVPVDLETLSPIVKSIMREGIAIAEETGVISYGDMIWLPHVLNLRPRQFLYILVDEAQDTNKAQQELLFKMRAPGGRMVRQNGMGRR